MRWTDNRMLAALEMRAAGRSAPEIAEAFGVPTAQVEQALERVDRELEESHRERERRAPPANVGVAIDLEVFVPRFEERWPGHGSRVRAAAHYGVTRRTVTRWLSGTTTIPEHVAREIIGEEETR